MKDVGLQSDARPQYDAAQRGGKERKTIASWLFLLLILLVEAAWVGAIITGIVWLTRLS